MSEQKKRIDYYPGGMTMPGRQTVGGEQYRYSYQGQELDPETGKPMFQLRLYDPRINRWLSPDPMGQYHSPYMAMDNRWNMSVDPTGGCTDCSQCPDACSQLGLTSIDSGMAIWNDGNDNFSLGNAFDSSSIELDNVFAGSRSQWIAAYQTPRLEALHQQTLNNYMKAIAKSNKEWRGAFAIALAPLAVVGAIEAAPVIISNITFAGTAKTAAAKLVGEFGAQTVGQLLVDGEISWDGYDKVNLATSSFGGNTFDILKSGVKFKNGKWIYLGNGITLSDFAVNLTAKKVGARLHNGFLKNVNGSRFNKSQEFILNIGSKTIIKSSSTYLKNYYGF